MRNKSKVYISIVSIFICIFLLLVIVPFSFFKSNNNRNNNQSNLNSNNQKTNGNTNVVTTDDIDKVIDYALIMCDIDNNTPAFYDNQTSNLVNFNFLLERQFYTFSLYLSHCLNVIYGTEVPSNGYELNLPTYYNKNILVNDSQVLIGNNLIDLGYNANDLTNLAQLNNKDINLTNSYLFKNAISGGYAFNIDTNQFEKVANPSGVSWQITMVNQGAIYQKLVDSVIINGDFSNRDYLGFSNNDTMKIIEFVKNDIIGASSYNNGIDKNTKNYRAYNEIIELLVKNYVNLMFDSSYNASNININNNYKVLVQMKRLVCEKVKASKLSCIDWTSTDAKDSITEITGDYKRYKSVILIPKLDESLKTKFNTEFFNIDFLNCAVQGSKGVKSELKLNLKVYTDMLVCNKTMISPSIKNMSGIDKFKADGTILLNNADFNANYDYLDYDIKDMVNSYCKDEHIVGKRLFSDYKGAKIDESFYTDLINKKTYLKVYNDLFSLLVSGEQSSLLLNATANYLMVDLIHQNIVGDQSKMNPLVKLDFFPVTY